MEKGGGKGQWSAWKVGITMSQTLSFLTHSFPAQAGELARQYEAKGGGYSDTGSNPNEAKKGVPQPKKSAVEKGERKEKGAPVGEPKKPKKSTTSSSSTKKTKSSAQSSTKKSTAGERAQPKRAAGRKAAAASA